MLPPNTSTPNLKPSQPAPTEAAPPNAPEQPPTLTNEKVREAQERSNAKMNAPQKDPWEGVVAAPMSAPAIDQIKKLNPNIEIRWVNRSCGTQTPTLRFEQCMAMGWVPATVKDVVPPPGTLKDGVIQHFDVVLMKIDRKAYLAHLKWNNDRVNQAVRRSGKAKTDEELRGAFAQEGVLNKARGKVESFVPGQNELERAFGK
jgi:hypothetical protein